jgi:hypothetical protein
LGIDTRRRWIKFGQMLAPLSRMLGQRLFSFLTIALAVLFIGTGLPCAAGHMGSKTCACCGTANCCAAAHHDHTPAPLNGAKDSCLDCTLNTAIPPVTLMSLKRVPAPGADLIAAEQPSTCLVADSTCARDHGPPFVCSLPTLFGKALPSRAPPLGC